MNVSRKLLKKALQAEVSSAFGYTPFLWRSPKIASTETINASVTGKVSFSYRIDQKKHIGKVTQKIDQPANANSYFLSTANTIIQRDINSNKKIILEAINGDPDSIFGNGVFDLLRNHQDYSLFYHHTCSECDGAGKLTCPTCYGSLSTICHVCSGYKTQKCNTCLGDGCIPVPFGQQTSAGYVQGTKIYTCSDCGGSGKEPCSSCAGSGSSRCSCITGEITCYGCSGHGALTTEQFVVVFAHLERFMQISFGSRIISSSPNDHTARYFNAAMPAEWVDGDQTEVMVKFSGPRIHAVLKTPGGECAIQFAAKDCSSVMAGSYTEYLFAKHLRSLNGFFQKSALRKIEKMPFIQTMIKELEAGCQFQDLSAKRYISAEQAEEFMSMRRKIMGARLAK